MFMIDWVVSYLAGMLDFCEDTSDDTIEDNAAALSLSDTNTAVAHSDSVEDTAIEQHIQMDNLPLELVGQILSELDSVRDRLVCARVNSEWRDLVQSKACWQRCTALKVQIQPSEHSLDTDGVPVAQVRYDVFDQSVGARSNECPLTEERLHDLRPLLPPTTHLFLENKLFHKTTMTESLFDGLGVLLTDVRLTELHIDCNVDVQFDDRFDDEDEHFYFWSIGESALASCHNLIGQLVEQSDSTLQLIHGVPYPEKKLLTIISKSAQINQLAFHMLFDDLYEDEDGNLIEGEDGLTDNALQLIASKRDVLRSLKVKMESVNPGTVAKLFNLCCFESTHKLQVQLHLEVNDKETLKVFDEQATSFTCPTQNIKTLKFELGYGFKRTNWMDPWLNGILKVWCPGLRRLIVTGGRDCFRLQPLPLVQKVLELIMQMNRGCPFDIMLPWHSQYPDHSPDMQFKEKLMVEYSGGDYICTELSLPRTMTERTGREDRYKWLLSIAPSDTNSRTRLNIYGAH